MEIAPPASCFTPFSISQARAGANGAAQTAARAMHSAVRGVFGPNGTFHQSPAQGAGWLACVWDSVL